MYFGRQRLAGCNPTVIKLCTEIPPGYVGQFVQFPRLVSTLLTNLYFVSLFLGFV